MFFIGEIEHYLNETHIDHPSLASELDNLRGDAILRLSHFTTPSIFHVHAPQEILDATVAKLLSLKSKGDHLYPSSNGADNAMGKLSGALFNNNMDGENILLGLLEQVSNRVNPIKIPFGDVKLEGYNYSDALPAVRKLYGMDSDKYIPQATQDDVDYINSTISKILTAVEHFPLANADGVPLESNEVKSIREQMRNFTIEHISDSNHLRRAENKGLEGLSFSRASKIKEDRLKNTVNLVFAMNGPLPDPADNYQPNPLHPQNLQNATAIMMASEGHLMRLKSKGEAHALQQFYPDLNTLEIALPKSTLKDIEKNSPMRSIHTANTFRLKTTVLSVVDDIMQSQDPSTARVILANALRQEFPELGNDFIDIANKALKTKTVASNPNRLLGLIANALPKSQQDYLLAEANDNKPDMEVELKHEMEQTPEPIRSPKR